jgi:hypothetical protein
MIDGPARLLRWLTRHGDDLDDLLGGEGGRSPGPGSVIEEVLQEAPELLRGPVLFGALQGLSRCEPTVAPGADGHAGQAQLPGHLLNAGVSCQSQDDGGPTDQALVSGLLALDPLQRGLLCRGDLDRYRSWSSHCPTPPANSSTIRSEPDSSVETSPPFRIATTAAVY